MSEIPGDWLAGLIDGEGCFRIQRNLRRTRGYAESYAPSFALKLRDDDENILRKIVEIYGGSLVREESRSGNSKPCVIWKMQSRKDCATLVRLLDRCPLRTRKARDYAVWRRAVEWWLTTPRGNRWDGPKDYSPIVQMHSELLAARKYRGEVMPECRK